MSFEDEFEQHQKETASTSEFYKFGIGDHVMRIMSEPVKKAQRFGYGVCYPGAPYCDPAVLEAELQKKMEAYGNEVEVARKGGATEKDLKRIKKPTRSNVSVKWSVWGLIRKTGEFAIVDLPNGVAEALLNLKRDKDMGTGFAGFPMPYDVKIIVTRKKVANPGPKDIEYSIVGSQTRKNVTEEEKLAFEKKAPISQILERMQAKAKEKFEGGDDADAEHHGGVEYPKDDINPDDIPF